MNVRVLQEGTDFLVRCLGEVVIPAPNRNERLRLSGTDAFIGLPAELGTRLRGTDWHGDDDASWRSPQSRKPENGAGDTAFSRRKKSHAGPGTGTERRCARLT